MQLKLVAAAKESVTVYGLYKTTMTDIAGRHTMSKSSLYYCFNDEGIIFHAQWERELFSLPDRFLK